MPLCYLYHDVPGLVISSLSVGYMWMQMRTWGFLMARMRHAYAEGRRGGVPVVDDVSHLPGFVKHTHTEGLGGLLTGQLIGTLGTSMRWLAPPGSWRSAADGLPLEHGAASSRASRSAANARGGGGGSAPWESEC